MRIYLFILIAGVSLFSVGCGGGSTPTNTKTTPPPATYTIGGSVSGLAGTGLMLQNNSGDNLPVNASATKFTFPTPITSGSAYKVSVMAQPTSPIQNCAIASGSGTANADITTVSVACTTVTYTVGGTISGLVGTGLVLQNNNGDNMPVTANATGFTFLTPLDSGTAYKVAVLTQPSNPMQNCAVTNATGTANGNVATVNIACTTITYSVSGTISGLIGTGLVLQDNSGDNLPVTANATGFTFATKIDGGAAYQVSILSQPSNPMQSCAVTAGSGTSGVNVANVLVACTNINEWTWVSGPQADDQSGIYGAQGVEDTANLPGARYWGSSWSDASGNFWLFGGYGYDSLGTVADTNDLWKGSLNSSGQWTWTWVGGANIAGVGGTYGTPRLG